MNSDSKKQQTAIIVAPNGARKSYDDHPAVPITNQEIIADVIACRDAGAAMVHLHARNKLGQHSLDIDDNIALYQSLKEQVGDSIVIQLTTEAVGIYQPDQQMALIKETQPEAASFALSELIPNEQSVNIATEFFHWVAEKQIIAQYILYSFDDLQRYFSLLQQGVLPANNHHILLVLGRYRKDQVSTPQDLAPFLQPHLLQNPHRWAVCAFGQHEHRCLTSAMLMGGDVRVGFENNHLNLHGTMAKNNATQVAQLISTAKELNIGITNARDFRESLTS